MCVVLRELLQTAPKHCIRISGRAGIGRAGVVQSESRSPNVFFGKGTEDIDSGEENQETKRERERKKKKTDDEKKREKKKIIIYPR